MAQGRGKIMILEDDPPIRQLIADILRDAGYQVVECSGAEEALSSFASALPDLITLDLAMPSMDGFQFLRRLEESADTARIPIVVVTAVPEPFRAPLQQRVEATISKPFHLEQLLTAVGQALGQ